MIEPVLAKRYRLLRQLGAGGFGRTYLAEDLQQGHRHCVVKHLTPASQSRQFLQTARRLFETEADVLRRLGEHNQIPALLDAFEAENEFYLVQAYVSGHPLSAELKSGQTHAEAEVIQWLQDVLPILDFIHQNQVIHRDIKPSNLMRRAADGRLVLIDFGAVKEITTQLQGTTLERFTISIGTQGYAPAEQLAGRPRYSSDLYALGMLVLQALTGYAPTEIPEHPETGELHWQAIAPPISPGLVTFLSRLTHPSVHQRYASAADALADLARLEELAAEQPTLSTTTLTPDTDRPPQHRLGSLLTALVMVVGILLVRQLGGWMPLELMVYDAMVRLQPALGPDPRLLILEITEADLRRLQRPTPADRTLADAIDILQRHQPRVIGLDMHRELPQGEGHERLLQTLAAPNIVAIRKIGNRPSEAIPAPATVPPEQVGFNDFPVDPDGVIRRNLLFASTGNTDDSEVLYSFGLRLVLQYLEDEGILPQPSAVNPDYLQLDEVVFHPLDANFGGYRGIDAAGYQLLLRYRANRGGFRRLSLTDLLEGQFSPDWIKDRMVLIGMTAETGKDLFYTPYSATASANHRMAGVTLHAQMASQLLSAVLLGRRLPWAWSEAWELLWILGWGAIGGGLGWRLSHPLMLGVSVIGALVIIVGTAAIASLMGGWIPVLAASFACLGSAAGVALYRTSRTHQAAILDATQVSSPSVQ